MKTGFLFLGFAVVLGLSLTLCGCNTASSGGGGGGGDDDAGDDATTDPLPEYQLEDDPELADDVGAITEADNEALACLDSTAQTEEDVLLALKNGYVSMTDPEETFPEFVASLVEPEQSKADEICGTTLENASADLLEQIQRLTTDRNRGRECQGQDPTLTDENSLAYLKTQYFGQSVQLYPTMLDFAIPFADEVELVTDDECGTE